jgi:UDP-N-acetylglucosamine 2-epimerase (non-hydrolysing)
MKVSVILGTRPEIIKLSPIIKQLNKKSTSVIFSGQHYDHNMSMRFIDQLGMGKPTHSLKIPKTKPNLQISEMIKQLSNILETEKPENVIVQGDTNTVLAAGIASLKCNISISHVESGLRSKDWRMPEEHNRIIVDNFSDYLFAPTQITKQNLVSENVHGKIFVTGNTVIDAINQFSKISKKYSKLILDYDDYVLLTLHRSENVDDKFILSSIIKSILDSKQKFIFVVHPRTKKRLYEFNLITKLKVSKNIIMFDPVGYFEMLELMKNCHYIVTDSGGIQEEATAPSIRKKVIVVRKTTDRPESVLSGFSKLTGTNYEDILKSLSQTAKNPLTPKKKSPYGNGDSAKKIIQHLQKNL